MTNGKEVEHFLKKHYLHASLVTSQAFDRSVLYISTGAFTISLFFIKDIDSSPSFISLSFLILSWILFAITIGASLGSLLLGMRDANRRYILEVEKEDVKESKQPRQQDEEMTSMPVSVSQKKAKIGKRKRFRDWFFSATTLNNLSIVALTIGIALLGVFAALNLYDRDSLGTEVVYEKQETKTFEEGC